MKSTPNTPSNSLRHIRLCTPIGTEAVHIEGSDVVGRWKQCLEQFQGHRNRLLVEEFVNWGSEPNDIVRFTERYAPLGLGEDTRPTEGQEFRFQAKSWQGFQQTIQSMWQMRMGRPGVSNTLGGQLPYDIVILPKQLIFMVHSLRFFLLMELITAPAERLRKCGRTDCPNPYFVARHLKQLYCSPICAGWAQALWKENWWKQKGKEWLKSRKRIDKKKFRRSRNKESSPRK